MITLGEVVEENLKDCLKLDAGDGKKGFVANSFAIAWLHRDSAKPLIIYNNGEPVGFVLIITSKDSDSACYISRLMIDKDHQRKGYAKAAMKLILDCIRRNSACQAIRLSYSPENITAKALYESLGFTANGEMRHGEIEMTLDLISS